MNRVIKLIRTDYSIIFILQTEGDDDFWWWEVSKEDFRNYWKNLYTGSRAWGVYGATYNTNQKQAEQFANDIENSDKGTSCSSFSTVEDALRDLGINI